MEQLFKDFHPAGAAAWKARLEKDLKGITFEQLSVTDRNGITINPFYTAEDLTGTPAALPLQNDWSICTQLATADAQQANHQALHELNTGASGLLFDIAPDTDPAVLLQDIELPYIHTHFRLGKDALPFAESLTNYTTAKDWQKAQMDCFLGFDCIADYLQQGQWTGSKEEATHTFRTLIATGSGNLCSDASLFHNAGATSVYELGCALAQLNEYLHLLEEKGMLTLVTKIHLTLAVDTAFFEQIAKQRAFRKLAAQLCNAYSIHPAIHLHVVTGDKYRSPFDSYSNLLRDTIAGMAAVAGGCDSLHLHAFDQSLKAPDGFSMRMARNQQLIFKEESYLHKVADVSAGSYYLETLTEQLAVKAWEQFKAIESSGGLIASFEKGIIQQEITAQAAQLVSEYKEGKRVLIGVNKFPNAKDEPKANTSQAVNTNGLQPLMLADVIL